jgi:hypothetical protein
MHGMLDPAHGRTALEDLGTRGELPEFFRNLLGLIWGPGKGKSQKVHGTVGAARLCPEMKSVSKLLYLLRSRHPIPTLQHTVVYGGPYLRLRIPWPLFGRQIFPSTAMRDRWKAIRSLNHVAVLTLDQRRVLT